MSKGPGIVVLYWYLFPWPLIQLAFRIFIVRLRISVVDRTKRWIVREREACCDGEQRRFEFGYQITIVVPKV